MESIENNGAVTALPEGSENGVAPRSDLSGLTCNWLVHHRHGWQFGEQGIIEAIAREINEDIPEEHRWCVEFGAGDSHTLPLTCDPVMRKLQWRALLIEADPKHVERLRRRVPGWATVVQGWVKPEDKETPAPSKTVDQYMEEAGCPPTPGLVVIDVDGLDYYFAAHMKARPAILCVEHMDTVCPKTPTEPFVPQPQDAGRGIMQGPDGKWFHLAANAQALDQTIPGMGYALAARTRINSIYVRNDLIGKVAKPPDTAVRLNLGAGGKNDPRYISIDIADGLDARKLDYADNSVDEVYASHLLEHFSFYQTPGVLAEWARVLKPGGIMRIAVPDIIKVAQDILTVEHDGGYRDLEMILYGAHSDPTNVHHAMFTRAKLAEMMNRAGIGCIREFDPFIEWDASNHPLSLNLEGTKRWWPKVEKPVVTLVLNQPRLAFTGHEIRLIELARKLDFNVQPCSGAFWDRDATGGTLAAIRTSDPDFLLYSDYDSIFEEQDVLTLLETINNDPQMAAIGAVQMSRHDDRPLVFEDEVDYTADVCRVKYQHFGLTIIRREVFDEMPQPWFWSIPGRKEDGSYDWDRWNRSDGDITFWRNMDLMGFRVCQHNKVCIGHIVQAIKYPRGSGRGVQLIPIENYWRAGKPKDAVFNPEPYRKKKVEIVAANNGQEVKG